MGEVGGEELPQSWKNWDIIEDGEILQIMFGETNHAWMKRKDRKSFHSLWSREQTKLEWDMKENSCPWFMIGGTNEG